MASRILTLCCSLYLSSTLFLSTPKNEQKFESKWTAISLSRRRLIHLMRVVLFLLKLHACTSRLSFTLCAGWLIYVAKKTIIRDAAVVKQKKLFGQIVQIGANTSLQLVGCQIDVDRGGEKECNSAVTWPHMLGR
ncbi:unnamed protein product [Toxocara canis]|uniref:Secreted protein n=1 Tax=Toxocara canis TaxID=6265 RepID=A0A183ULM5_TOXCA|nr:unnamed protein product [Toxocara canis]